MTEQNNITIQINGKSITCKPGQNIIDVADEHGIYIPRFCYHKNLSIVANCRMCLVEVERVPKPLPACATSVMDGMVVKTNSDLARRAQKGVMEFLLINHPLDCPICDQGGECELQDLSMGYGASVSRFSEGKRAVADEDLGPLISTHMTRCIHCTRCVRFGREVAGEAELGACGRGGHMEIGTYLEKGVRSELSGNMIDLCPVGALTSKPFAYKDRSWRFDQHHSIAPHDCVGSNIYVHTVNKNIGKKSEVMRVLPRENNEVNQTWISDRDRFSYTALTGNRITEPMIKKNGTWEAVSWADAITHMQAILETVLSKDKNDAAMLLSPSTSCEEGYLAQKWWRASGAINIDHRLRWADSRDDEGYAQFPISDVDLNELSAAKDIQLIGAQPRENQPMFNLRIRQAALAGAKVNALHSHQLRYNFEINQHIHNPSEWVSILHGYAQSKGVKLDEVWASEPSQNILPVSDEKTIWVLGAEVATMPHASLIRYLVNTIAEQLGHRVIMLTDGANSAGLWLSGAVGHRLEGGQNAKIANTPVSAFFQEKKSFYWLHQVEPEFDSLDPSAALHALEGAFVVSCASHWSNAMKKYADLVLPISAYTEFSGTYINYHGHVQSFRAAQTPPGGARPGWKVYRLLGHLTDESQFNFESVNEVWQSILPKISEMKTTYQHLVRKIEAFPKGVMRIGYLHAMSADSLVRKSVPLQGTIGEEKITFSAKTAQMFALNDQVKSVLVSQGAAKVRFDVEIDNNVSDGCVVLPGGTATTQALGHLTGSIVLESADV